MQEHRETAPLTGDPKMLLVDRAMQRVQCRPDALIEVLHTAQEAFGYLSRELLAHVAAVLGIPESGVYGVATFYHFFTLQPPSEHSCVVCIGTVCHVKGGGELKDALEKRFGVREGDTGCDGRLYLGTARCLGMCSLAPVMVLDDLVYGRESPAGSVEKVGRALEVRSDRNGAGRTGRSGG